MLPVQLLVWQRRKQQQHDRQQHRMHRLQQRWTAGMVTIQYIATIAADTPPIIRRANVASPHLMHAPCTSR